MQISQTEKQIAVAYTQQKYDAIRELKIGNKESKVGWSSLENVREKVESEETNADSN